MTENTPPLYTYPFVCLCLVALFGFGNIAVFYGFYPYLISIGISPSWAGWLLALEPLTALLLRPLISPRLGPGNALVIMRISLLMIALALLGYAQVTSAPMLAALRIFHGAAFVTLVSATTALLVHFIPASRSGQAFGIFSLTTMLPFALMPPLMEALLPHTPSVGHAYAWISLMTLPALMLLIPLGPHARQVRQKTAPGTSPRGLGDIGPALRQPGIRPLLGASLLTFLSSTLLFFFMKDFGTSLGLANAGLFFTVSTGATIAVRLVSHQFFDRVDKRRLLLTTLGLLTGCYAVYSLLDSPVLFLVTAGLFGACMGVALPLLQSILFVMTDPARRGLSANLMLSTMDAGYFLGPYLGAQLLSLGLVHADLFRASALMALGALVLIRVQGAPAPNHQP